MKTLVNCLLTVGLVMAATSWSHAASAIITVTPVTLPPKAATTWVPSANQLIEDVVNGTLTNTAQAGIGYRLSHGLMTWQSAVYPANIANWNGDLIQWQVNDLRSSTGTDDISLDSVSVTSFSSDGNYLGDTLTFAANTYTPQAIGIKADGSRITSGSSSQKAARVIVLTQMKLFNVGDTEGGRNSVRDWINGQVNATGNYSITYTAQLIGMPATASMARVRVVDSPTIVAPHVGISASGHVWAVNGVSNTTYRILSSPTADGPTWSLAGITSYTNAAHVGLTGGPKFFRLQVQ